MVVGYHYFRKPPYGFCCNLGHPKPAKPFLNLLHVVTFVCRRWWATVFTTRSFEDMVLPVDGSARNWRVSNFWSPRMYVIRVESWILLHRFQSSSMSKQVRNMAPFERFEVRGCCWFILDAQMGNRFEVRLIFHWRKSRYVSLDIYIYCIY